MTTALLQNLRDILGNGQAFAVDDERAEGHRRRFSGIAEEVNREIAAVALPDSAGTLQKTLQLALKENLAVWHQPNGAGNGVSLSRRDGAVLIVDTRNMNRILEVDPASAWALMEPGVSYRQLYDHLKAKNIPLWIDSDREPEHSVAGSICRRHIGYTPYGEHFLMQCGMEVVLSNGDLLRTGMGALPGNNTWQLFKYNFGPYLDGLFSQSDMAVPGKIGLWLMPAPPAYFPFMVTLPRLEDLGAVVEILRPLKLGSVIPNTVAISHAAFDAAVSGGRRGEFMEQGEPRQAVLAEKNLGVWNVYGALYGGRDNIDLTWQALAPALLSIDGARLYKGEDRGADPLWQSRRRLMGGMPLEAPMDLSDWGGSRYWHMTMAAPMEGEFAMQMRHIVKKAVTKSQVEYLCEYALTGRTMLKQIYLPYDDGDKDAQNKIKQAAVEIITNTVAAGFAVVDESPELRHTVDGVYGGNGFTNLVGRLESSLREHV